MVQQTSSYATRGSEFLKAHQSAASTEGEGDEARHLLAFRLLALACGIYLAKFLLGLVRYVLDFALCVLVLGGVVAIFRPGPKDGVVSKALAQLEAFVAPLYAVLADHSLSIASGPLSTLARYLGISPDPASRPSKD
ncbi:hypothetical protein GGI04_004012 [Coemansia thaxteri]|nr:hypothetical protein GGI04_004012 [Coemansia thaxteri]KAJ2471390.1 hypothetical protein EV174_005967 [Coemansia sp. RSA 2320]